MTNENDKDILIKNLDMKNLSKEEQDKIIKEIRQLDFDKLNKNTLKNLQYTYQNEISDKLEKTQKIFKEKILGKWYNKEKNMDDLIIAILIFVLIIVILIKFNIYFSDLSMFLLKKIILPNLLIVLIILFIIILYIYKKNLVYNIFDFIIIWFKILTFQWLF